MGKVKVKAVSAARLLGVSRERESSGNGRDLRGHFDGGGCCSGKRLDYDYVGGEINSSRKPASSETFGAVGQQRYARDASTQPCFRQHKREEDEWTEKEKRGRKEIPT